MKTKKQVLNANKRVYYNIERGLLASYERLVSKDVHTFVMNVFSLPGAPQRREI